ncbi:unnamed protein product, partial [Brassica napus]
NKIQTSSSSPPQFVVTTTVPNLTDLVSVISIFITTKPCHHQTSSSSPPRFIVVATTALRVYVFYLFVTKFLSSTGNFSCTLCLSLSLSLS